jgi:hypothetical protein
VETVGRAIAAINAREIDAYLACCTENNVIVFMRTSATGRTSGIVNGTESTNVYDFVEGRISRIRIFLDRDEALKAVRLAE